jgi:hypothetical protein
MTEGGGFSFQLLVPKFGRNCFDGLIAAAAVGYYGSLSDERKTAMKGQCIVVKTGFPRGKRVHLNDRSLGHTHLNFLPPESGWRGFEMAGI